MMARNVERLAQFTTEVLTLSRLESGKYKLLPKFLPLMEVVEPVMDLMMTRASGRKSTLKLDIAPELSAFADADSLGMVVTNLTNNAIVHTPEGTSVTISARQLNGDFVEVSVSDTGEGIEQEHLEYLFQRFYQAKRRASATYKGTGIGLAVCKALVEAMGGGISVESHVGEGTSFRFTLPARRA
jgi:signal transduction histidine kinase